MEVRRRLIAPIIAFIVITMSGTTWAQAPGSVKWLSVKTDRKALLFEPGSEVQVTLEIAKAAGKTLNWRAVTQQENELARNAEPIAPSADQATQVDVKLGKLAEGFYVIRLELIDDKGAKQRTSVPVAMFGPPPPADAPESTEPFFPVGVYDKYIINRDPVVSNTYLHAICWTLRKAGLNCITSGNTLLPPTTAQLDIAQSWGIKVLVRADLCDDPKVLTHPAVPVLMYGDEPKVENIKQYKEQYDKIQALYPDKAIITAMVGDSYGARGGHDPAVVWNMLQPKIRFVRAYLIRRNHYDLMHRRVVAGTLPANAVFQLVDQYGDTPWWFCSQTFGQIATETRPEAYWGNPTATELSGLTHLALAHGAKGLVGWAFQTHWQTGGKDVPCLVKQDTLAPEDGKWQAWIDVTKFATRFKPILADAKRGGCEPVAEAPDLELVPRQTSDGRRFVYIVNMNSRKEIESDMWFFNNRVLGMRDLVDDKEIPMTAGGTWGKPMAHVKLKPGEGRLYQVTVMSGPMTADRIDTKAVLPFLTDPIEPMGPDEHTFFKQVQALPEWWKFAPDTEDAGQTKKWFAADFDDSAWGYLMVGEFWDNQGVKDLKGHAWYRTTFVPTEEIVATRDLKLFFMGADESAWVYLNGEHVCTHYPDNVDGWDRSFAIDLAGKLKPGVPNTIAVRILNRAAAGGIYGKVALVVPGDPRPEGHD